MAAKDVFGISLLPFGFLQLRCRSPNLSRVSKWELIGHCSIIYFISEQTKKERSKHFKR